MRSPPRHPGHAGSGHGHGEPGSSHGHREHAHGGEHAQGRASSHHGEHGHGHGHSPAHKAQAHLEGAMQSAMPSLLKPYASGRTSAATTCTRPTSTSPSESPRSRRRRKSRVDNAEEQYRLMRAEAMLDALERFRKEMKEARAKELKTRLAMQHEEQRLRQEIDRRKRAEEERIQQESKKQRREELRAKHESRLKAREAAHAATQAPRPPVAPAPVARIPEFTRGQSSLSFGASRSFATRTSVADYSFSDDAASVASGHPARRVSFDAVAEGAEYQPQGRPGSRALSHATSQASRLGSAESGRVRGGGVEKQEHGAQGEEGRHGGQRTPPPHRGSTPKLARRGSPVPPEAREKTVEEAYNELFGEKYLRNDDDAAAAQADSGKHSRRRAPQLPVRVHGAKTTQEYTEQVSIMYRMAQRNKEKAKKMISENPPPDVLLYQEEFSFSKFVPGADAGRMSADPLAASSNGRGTPHTRTGDGFGPTVSMTPGVGRTISMTPGVGRTVSMTPGMPSSDTPSAKVQTPAGAPGTPTGPPRPQSQAQAAQSLPRATQSQTQTQPSAPTSAGPEVYAYDSGRGAQYAPHVQYIDRRQLWHEEKLASLRREMERATVSQGAEALEPARPVGVARPRGWEPLDFGSLEEYSTAKTSTCPFSCKGSNCSHAFKAMRGTTWNVT